MKKLFILSVMCFFLVTTVNVFGAEVTLKVGSIESVGGVQHRAMEWVMSEVEKRSDGMLKIDYYPANQLGSTNEQFDSLMTGTIDIFLVGGNCMESMGKEYMIDAIPFIFRDKDHRLAYQSSELNKKRQEILLNKLGVRVIADNWYYQPHVLLSTKPILTPEDLDGFKMRVPESRGQFIGWKAIGTNPATVPWGEVYLALKQGVVDGVSSNFEAIKETRFAEVAPNVIMLETEFGYDAVLMNDKSYQEIPINLRNILVETLIEGGDKYSELSDQEADEVREYIEENDYMKVIEVDDELFRVKLAGLPEKLEKEGLIKKEALDEVKDL
ncbi:Sialic acid-binding periplasmic protein SiaP [subsurface metagenome]